jgi:hypothetical protein
MEILLLLEHRSMMVSMKSILAIQKSSEWDGSAWTQLGPFINGEAAVDESSYSFDLSCDGMIVATGAPYNNGNGGNSRHVRVFE